MATNRAAWLVGPKAHPFEIKPAPMGVPKEHQVLIKNHAIAINPINGKIQALAFFPLEYPVILGEDVAGEVVKVGSDVTRFQVGDRVIGLAAGHKAKQDGATAFQEHTILQDDMVCKISDNNSYEDAVVLPLGISTAACGLFHADFLRLDLPTEPPKATNGKTLLVMGGASSVGSNAIQLAKAAGYDVVATASKTNFDYVQQLGASKVFDYANADVVAGIAEHVEGKHLIGVFDAIGGSALQSAIEVVRKSATANFVATVLPYSGEVPKGVVVKQVQALYLMDNEIGKAIWEDFLPYALATGNYKCAPAPLIAGHGLESLQSAVDMKKKGTSARKVIVKLD